MEIGRLSALLHPNWNCLLDLVVTRLDQAEPLFFGVVGVAAARQRGNIWRLRNPRSPTGALSQNEPANATGRAHTREMLIRVKKQPLKSPVDFVCLPL